MALLPLLVLGLIVYLVASSRDGRRAARPELREVAADRWRPGAGYPGDASSAGWRTDWRTAMALGRSEARRLLRHPAVLVGAVPSLLGLFFNEGSALAADQAVAFAPVAAFPLAGLTLVAVNLAVLRSRRHGTDELLAPAPGTARARTLGHLLSVVAPMAIMALLAGVWLAAFALADVRAGTLGIAHAVELVSAVVLVGCAGACGVLLARLVPSSAIAPLAVVALGIAEGFLAANPQPETNRLRWLAWWVPQPDNVPVELWPREAGWHLLYLVALGVLVAAVAVLRHGLTRATGAVAAGAAVVVVASGIVQVQPMTDGELRRAAAWVAEPDAHQRCRTADDVTTCAYPGYDFSDEWRPVATGIAAALPDHVAGSGVLVRQRLSSATLHRIPPAVHGRLDPGWTTAGASQRAAVTVHPELRWGGNGTARAGAELALGVNLAARIMGLPAESDEQCFVGGQARGVAVLWLAGRSTSRAESALHRLVASASSPPEVDPHAEAALAAGEGAEEWLDSLLVTVGVDHWVMDAPVPLVWGPGDAVLAGALLRLPQAEVAGILEQHWDELRRPETTSARLAELAGLPAPRPIEADAARAGLSPAQTRALKHELEPTCS